VLYGIFPCIAVGAALSALRLHASRRPLVQLRAASATIDTSTAPPAQLRDVYRFAYPGQVEQLARVARKWDLDGVPDPPSAVLGEFVIRCGMARFPNNPAMLTLYANFLIEARKDGQASRTQLQLAVKNAPGAIERYFIYVSQELAKKLKSEGDGLDLMGYVEFQRNYRCVCVCVLCAFVVVCVCFFGV
jgi:hypothetical protein